MRPPASETEDIKEKQATTAAAANNIRIRMGLTPKEWKIEFSH
tara:strand:- start:487 stop:615 length:129 start_codon:yes stop_codon:yes gene_type:complete